MGVGVGVGLGVDEALVDGRALASADGASVAVGEGVEQPDRAQAAAKARATKTRGVVTGEL